MSTTKLRLYTNLLLTYTYPGPVPKGQVGGGRLEVVVGESFRNKTPGVRVVLRIVLDSPDGDDDGGALLYHNIGVRNSIGNSTHSVQVSSNWVHPEGFCKKYKFKSSCGLFDVAVSHSLDSAQAVLCFLTQKHFCFKKTCLMYVSGSLFS